MGIEAKDKKRRLAVHILVNAEYPTFCHPECDWLPEKGDLQVCQLWSECLPLRRSGPRQGRFVRCRNCTVWAKERRK